MQHPIPVAAALLAAALSLGACAGTGNHEGERPAPHDDVVQVVVNNAYYAPVVIYATRGGVRARLGLVSPMGRGSFRLPETIMAGGAALRLVADPVGEFQEHPSEPIAVARGQRIEWNLESNLTFSSLMVR